MIYDFFHSDKLFLQKKQFHLFFTRISQFIHSKELIYGRQWNILYKSKTTVL